MDVLTALGLAAPAGLNAPLVLLLVGLAGRFTGLVELPDAYDWIETWPALAVLGAWLLAEEILDKVPGADHVNDAVNTALRPAAGAVLALALTQGELPPALGAALGLLVAGSAHAAKAGARPAVTVGTAGTGNPLASVAEDVIAVLAVAIALLVPLLVVIVLAALAWALVTVVRHARRLGRARPAAPPP